MAKTMTQDLKGTIRKLRVYGRQRRTTVRSINRLKNRSRAYVRSVLGWRPDLPEKERNRINRKAARIVNEIEAGDQRGRDNQSCSVARPLVLAFQATRLPLDKFRANLEREMRAAARSLPVYEWVKDMIGLADLGLALIVAEAGDLSHYANPGKLWKRFGLAPYKGKACSTWRKEGGLTGDEWESLGYNPSRCSIMYNIGESIVKAGKGEYRRVYDDRKEYELPRESTKSKLHAHKKAMRYAEKRLLRDLWRAWR